MGGVYRVAGTGSREWDDPSSIFRVLDELLLGEVRQIHFAQGGARGADRHMLAWCQRIIAEDRGRQLSAMQRITDKGDASTRVRIETYTAKWGSKAAGTFDRAAGFKRNERMIKEHRPELVLAFVRDNSSGSLHCADIAVEAGIRTIVFQSTGNVAEYNANGPTDTEACLSPTRRNRRTNIVY